MNNEMLMKTAQSARQNAHCPYSGFAVGAALLTQDGTVFTGCNIENASYSLGVCAERTAFFKAVSVGHKEFQAIAVCGGPKGEAAEAPCIPCGACLQVMAEFCGDDFVILLSDGVHKLSDFLPKRFVL